MRVGASLNQVWSEAVVEPVSPIKGDRRFGHWRLLFGGLLGTLLLSAAAYASPVHIAETVPETSPETVSNVIRPIADGTYFYGSTTQPDEIGHAYMVFEAQDSAIVGAIYMPHSSFDCFRGHVRGNELALQITNSYTQEVYDYPIALVVTGDPVASVGTPEVPLQIEGFHDLGSPRAVDTELLATCRANLIPAEMEL